MTIDSLEIVVLTCVFIIPGFIMQGTIALFVPPKNKSDGVMFLSFLLFSVLHCAVWGWLYFFIWKLKEINTTLFIAIAAISTVITSFVFGVIIGLFKKFSVLRKILNKLHCNISHEVETSWEYIFSKQEACYVVVLLNDDTKVRGLLGCKSFVSSTHEERDIFLEQYFDEDWHMVDGNKGIYIAKNQIKTINFYEGAIPNGTEE